jgi:hypothetical protein
VLVQLLVVHGAPYAHTSDSELFKPNLANKKVKEVSKKIHGFDGRIHVETINAGERSLALKKKSVLQGA